MTYVLLGPARSEQNKQPALVEIRPASCAAPTGSSSAARWPRCLSRRSCSTGSSTTRCAWCSYDEVHVVGTSSGELRLHARELRLEAIDLPMELDGGRVCVVVVGHGLAVYWVYLCVRVCLLVRERCMTGRSKSGADGSGGSSYGRPRAVAPCGWW